jgi:hypothetical protein
MTKLTSGRVEKVDSANVSADRYQFLSLKEAEPDLGLPTTAGQVFTSNTTGSRYWTTLDTGNVVETSNLYYSNARVLSNVSLMSINVLADVDITYKSLGYGLIWDGNNWVANVITVSGTELSNVANTVLTIVQGQIAGLQANNAIFSNTAAVANVATFANVAGFANVSTFANVANIANTVVSISNFTTANLAETASNLYFTNARSRAALSAGTGIIYDTANGIISANADSIVANVTVRINSLTTANIAEAASNLYFTNARVLTALSNATIQGNLTVTNSISANTLNILGNIIAGGGVGGTLSGLDRVISNIILANTIVANIWNGLYTANVIETSGNLYFTNTRSRNALSAGAGIIYDTANGIITANTSSILSGLSATVTGLTTANVSEVASNLYYTNTRSRAALSAGTGIIYDVANGIISTTLTGNIANVTATVAGLTTANVAEAASNLYYTNARSRAALSAGTGIIYDNGTGVISIGQNVSTGADVTFNRVTILSNLSVYGNVTTFASNNLSVSDNMIYLNSNSLNSNPDLGFAGNYNDGIYRHTGFFRDATDGTWKVFDNYTPEPDANIFIDTAHVSFRLANFAANVVAANTLYSNTIVANNITINGVEIVTGGTGEANIAATRITTNSISSNIWIGLYTANVIETSGNLYFTNARVLAALSNANIQGNLTINSTLISNGLIVNGIEIVTGGSGEANITASRLTTNIITANIWNGLYTGNIIETTGNLYYSNARVLAALSNATIQGNLTINSTLIANGLIINGIEIVTGTAVESNIAGTRVNANNIISNTITANVWNGLYTANVIESNSNLYYTNARARSALSAGTGITYDPATGVITATGAAAASNATYTGNVIAGNLIALGRLYANGITINGTELITGNTTESNINVTRITANVGIFANLVGSNLYFGNINSGNLIIGGGYGGNLTGAYILGTEYANINSNLIVGNINSSGILIANEIRANIFTLSLTTANVAEATSNLYFTNARVITALSNANIRGNLTINNILIANGLIVNGIEIVTGGANESNVFATRINANTIVANTITSNNWAGIYTANVIESASNLYFTNARVLAALSNANIQGNLTINSTLIANGLIINGIEIVTGGANESNIFATRINANSITANSITSNIWNGLYTANVIETSGNLYYTNARSRAAISAGTGIIYDTANGIITANTSSILSGLSATVTGLTTANVSESAASGNLYYSNARVLSTLSNANIQGNLTINNILIANGIIINGIEIVTGGANESNIFATRINANSITANTITSNIWSGLYTANVIETTGNLYFTNTRSRLAISAGTGIVYDSANGIITANLANITANVTATINGLTTADIDEVASNLYYTNTRSRLAISAGSGISYDNTTGVITANIANITANVTATINGLTTADIDENAASGNLYYTNARVYSNVITLLSNIQGIVRATGNITTDANIIANGLIIRNINVADSVLAGNVTSNTSSATAFTANTITANTITANVWNRLYTANVIETSSNLYFTNARVFANVIALLPQYTGNLQLGNLAINNRITANILDIGPEQTGGTISGANTIATNTIISNTWIGLYTANVLEDGQNIFYTNARVYANVSEMSVNVLFDVDITGINTNQILVWDGSKFIPGNTGTSGLASNTALTTANVRELPGNLYYTNARVYSNIISLLPYYTGALSGNNITATNSATVGNLIVLGNLFVSGNAVSFYANNLVVNDPMIQLGFGNPGDTYDLGFIGHYNDGAIERHAGLFRDHTDQKFKFFDNLTSEPGLNDLDTANASFRLAVVAAKTIEGNLIGNVTGYVSSISNFTTSNLVEGANLYFTNTRVYANIAPLLTTANVNEIASSGNLYYSNLRVNAYVQPWLTTANVSEVTNLYFTNTRVYANIAPLLTTANVAEVTNLYYSNARVYANISPLLTTANVAEVTNLYFTNTRVYTNVIALLANLVGEIRATGNIISDANIIANGLIIRNITVSDNVLAGNITASSANANAIVAVTINATGNITTDANLIANGLIIRNINVSDSVLTGSISSGNTTSNVILTDSITANIWNRLYTANVLETTGNLYFTNARTRSALSAGSGISYDNNTGVISSAITTILSDSVTVISTGNLSYNIGTSVSDPKRILVSIEGMLQIPTTDYSVSGSTLTFPSAPPVGANIEVKFFGTETLNSTPTLVSKVDSFVATGSSLVFNLSMLPTSKDYVTVLIDGVLQQSDVYTLSGNTITLSDSPAVGSNVDIRMIGGRVGSSYNTRTFTGNGAANAFTLTNGFTNDTVLVFENGVAQMPGSDYTITNDVLTFTTAPAANVIVQVRELGIAGPNVAAAISGFDQVTGNLVPTLDLIKNLGSSTKRWNQLYLKSNGLVLGNVTIGATDTTLTLTSNTGATTTLYTSLTAARASAFGLSLIFGG